jgi:hypothetical protein
MIVGMLVGTAFGNPIIGCVIGAGLSTPLGILAETGIAKANIDDPRVRSEIEEATVGRYIYETLRNMRAAGTASFAAEWLSEAIGPEIDTIMKGLMAAMAKRGIPTIVDFSLYGILKR